MPFLNATYEWLVTSWEAGSSSGSLEAGESSFEPIQNQLLHQPCFPWRVTLIRSPQYTKLRGNWGATGVVIQPPPFVSVDQSGTVIRPKGVFS
eukprot:1158839-Pelagomonas_calceolata.AAC.3